MRIAECPLELCTQGNRVQHRVTALMPGCWPSLQVELLSWKSIKDIGGDGGVVKTVEKEGSGWTKPSDADEVLGAQTPSAAPLHLAVN